MALEYAFENIKPGDVVNVGMHRGDTDTMVEENVSMVKESFARLPVTGRPAAQQELKQPAEARCERREARRPPLLTAVSSLSAVGAVSARYAATSELHTRRRCRARALDRTPDLPQDQPSA